ncbi:DUF1837 domain-containing protein [Priestia megaterium]|uniref:HamA C-terminal domain-containing protein n=1 Tax=Priestia megaterium TaxID=1404 RepID=UPI003458B5F7
MTNSTAFNSELLFEKYIDNEQVNGFSIGYECSEFRYEALVELLFEALPDFALTQREKDSLGASNVVRKMRRAAKLVYSSKKYERRGEFGEILLHVLMRDFFFTIPAISKLFYKDGANETVKGFDAVHIVPRPQGLELWLGEVKFYQDISSAITAVVKELDVHTGKDYLRSEFLFISNKVDESWGYAQEFKDLIDEKNSLDNIFQKIRIPVLLTYNSVAINSYDKACEEYKGSLIREMNIHHDKFRSNTLPEVEILLMLVPLKDKVRLINELDNKLRVWQNL